MKYDAVIFDMDGTILNTLEDLAGTLNYSLRCYGFPERTLPEVRSFVGNGIRMLVRRGCPAGTPEEVQEKVYEAYQPYYKEHCADKTRPYDGIPELIASLRKAGIKTAVVSNKGDIGVQDLCRCFFDGLFDTAVGERTGIRRKPAPDSVNEVLSILRIPKERAVYIGDSEVDIETAANAGIDCILVEWGFRTREALEAAGAGRIARDVRELEGFLL